jgi:hypothetical protein
MYLHHAMDCFMTVRRFSRMGEPYTRWAKNWDINSWQALFWAAEDGEI